MTEDPPRLAIWLIEASRVPDAEAVAGDLLEEFSGHIVPIHGRLRARLWFLGQVARSLAPLIFRSWERASLMRASIAIAAAATASTLPVTVLLSLRSFVLSQVPLKTSAELSPAFGLLAVVVALLSTIVGLALATRILFFGRR